MKKKKTHPHPQVTNRTKCSETMKYEKKKKPLSNSIDYQIIGCWRNLIVITFGSGRANQAWGTDPGYTPLPKWGHLLCKPPVSLARHLLIQPSGGHPCKQNKTLFSWPFHSQVQTVHYHHHQLVKYWNVVGKWRALYFHNTRVLSVIVCLVCTLRLVETKSCFLHTLYASLPWFCVPLDFYVYYMQKFVLTRPLFPRKMICPCAVLFEHYQEINLINNIICCGYRYTVCSIIKPILEI